MTEKDAEIFTGLSACSMAATRYVLPSLLALPSLCLFAPPCGTRIDGGNYKPVKTVMFTNTRSQISELLNMSKQLIRVIPFILGVGGGGWGWISRLQCQGPNQPKTIDSRKVPKAINQLSGKNLFWKYNYGNGKWRMIAIYKDKEHF